MKKYKNPIIPGFYPDPSICRVDDDYYLVTSSFEFFPGIPIFHSKDLVHWSQIGHVLDRPSQLDLDGVGPSKGIYAPTIRYHEGVYYVISTNVEKGGNFIVTSQNPKGPWSDPIWLEDCPGFDPSLFFEDDGRVYFTGTCESSNGLGIFGDLEIWLQELDLKSMKLIGKRQVLWSGTGGLFPEGPHIYKVGKWYYLMIAEGTTFHYHSITIARSENLFGPYEGCPHNPILTHRNLGREHPITNVGHGDIVQTQNGEWWMVVLGSRQYGGYYDTEQIYFGGYYRNMGRETFLVPLVWENEWPVINPGIGRVEFEHQFPDLPEAKVPSLPACDHFDKDELAYSWNFLRTPREKFWNIDLERSVLKLRLRPESLKELENPSFIARRQQHINYTVRTHMSFTPESNNECGGIVLFQNQDFHYRFIKTLNGSESEIKLIKRFKGKDECLGSANVQSQKLYLKVEAREQDLSFYYGEVSEEWQTLVENVDGRILSTDIAGGELGLHTGAYIGLYASSNGMNSENSCEFDWFEYIGDYVI